MSSRLFQEVREKAGLAYTVECDFIPFAGNGICAIYLALKPKSLPQCVKILSREMAQVVKNPISSKNLEMVKNQIKGSVILSSESTEARQESLGRNEISFGRRVTIDEIVREIDKVSSESVQRVAKRLFVPEKESVITLSRVKPKQRKVSLFV
jgi:predicted Zn-dependent peptidase